MNNISILVLEDHTFQRELAISALKELGVQHVFSASDGHAALDLLKQTGPVDIVLCDLKMPGMDGLAFLRLASQSRLVKAVMLCTEIDPDLRRAALQMVSFLDIQVLADLGKPLQQSSLRNALALYKEFIPETPAPITAFTPEHITKASIDQAMNHQQFHGYYQPKFQLNTQDLSGAEVLARWLHPQFGLIGPNDFLWAVESFGQLDNMILSLLEQGLEMQTTMIKLGMPLLELAFNLHPSQLSSLTLTTKIQDLLSKYDRAPSSIVFEITETGLPEIEGVGLENLIRLRMMGCGLSIDDFGVGHSSLQRLAELPFNQIKLDAIFIRNYKKQPRCKGVIQSTLALGKSLDMQVVIEGIETEQQRKEIIHLGGTLAQGYWYAKPMGQFVFIEWLKDKHQQ